MPKARSELNEYIFDNLQFADQTRNCAKKREVPYGIKKEKRNNANKILNGTVLYALFMKEKACCIGTTKLLREGNYGQALQRRQLWPSSDVLGEAFAQSKIRAQ